MTHERRNFVDTIELRGEGDRQVAAGHAAVFGKLSQNLGGFVERVAPGAFSKTLVEQDVRALYNHDDKLVLGRLSSGTLRMVEDGDGLSYEVDLPNTTTGRDVAELLRRGDVTGSSFGFRVLDDEWGETETGFPLRTLRAVSLHDVGPVTFPAYMDATASLRSLALRSLAESRSLDLSTVVAAAEAGALRSVISPASPVEEPLEEVDDRAKPIVYRRPFVM